MPIHFSVQLTQIGQLNSESGTSITYMFFVLSRLFYLIKPESNFHGDHGHVLNCMRTSVVIARYCTEMLEKPVETVGFPSDF